MRPTLGQCRAGIRSAAVFSRSSSLALLGAFTFYLLLSSLTAPPARHVRPFYRPAQTWNEQRKQLRPRVPAIVPARHVSITVDPPSASAPEFIPPVISTPYANLTIGVVRETYPNERRVAITPQNAALLLKKGFKRVLVERGAGAEAQFTDQAYLKAGVTLGDSKEVWSESDILLKVRAPSFDGPLSEADQLKKGATIISFIYPAQNQKTVDRLANMGTTSFAMDLIPRISRAQVFDALR
jgi:NAD(P) transhydrogenase